LKIVLDTNIWISALLYPNSKAGKILDHWRASKFDIVTSQSILDELKDVLTRPKIAKHVGWDEAKIDQYVTLLKFITECISIKPEQITVQLENNPGDTMVLTTLLLSKANYLVTGDDDLLKLKEQHPILSLSQFFEMLY
jgi:uncharacterized protein